MSSTILLAILGLAKGSFSSFDTDAIIGSNVPAILKVLYQNENHIVNYQNQGTKIRVVIAYKSVTNPKGIFYERIYWRGRCKKYKNCPHISWH